MNLPTDTTCPKEVVLVNTKQLWQTTIERLQTKVPPSVFITWFQGTSAHSFDDGVFVLHVPSTFTKEHLERRFLDVIRSALMEVIGEPIEVQIEVARDKTTESNNDISGKQNPYTSHRRPYRLPKNRLTSLSGQQSPPQRRGILGEYTPAPSQENIQSIQPAVSMNSLAPLPARPAVHRDTDKEHQDSHVQPYHNILEEQEQYSAAPQSTVIHNEATLLNPRYTFNAFIVGKCNQLAHAASLAVSENPGGIYNPLFFYGGVGLGKTHLLHAIGHVGESAGMNVLYVTSEKFTNEIINAIRYQKTEEFRNRYRQIDILLVDDIQFIAGKESTEEEFFHTFNTLYDTNKQIVVTSDRPPKAIHSLQDRLRSRFEWGLLVDIQLPEYEHRLAILRSKAEMLRFRIPSSVIDYIARPEYSSIRELEGSLNRVIAYGTLHDEPLSVSLAAKALEQLQLAETRTHFRSMLTLPRVLEGVCSYYNVDLERLKSKQREREISWPRQVAMYVMREETDASLLQIGTALGGRDHSTVMHGWEKVQAEMAKNEQVRQEIAKLLEILEKG
ncbi:MAG: chromosomal replication initiator protein DnaA [Chloroflexota bacterium]|nr:chromosomal replication initiator protein DnaA [Chloroflexota bacterium]